MVVCYGFFSKKVGKHCGRLFTCCSRWRQRQQNPQQKVPKSTESKVGLVSDWCLNVTSSQEEKRVKSYLANIAAGGSAGPRSIQLFLFWFQGGAEFGKKTKKNKNSVSSPVCKFTSWAASENSSINDHSRGSAGCSVQTHTGPLAGQSSLLQRHCCYFNTRSHVVHIRHLYSGLCYFFIFYFFCCCGKYSSVAVAPFWRLTSAFNLVCFLRHVFCLASFPNSSGLVLIRVK